MLDIMFERVNIINIVNRVQTKGETIERQKDDHR